MLPAPVCHPPLPPLPARAAGADGFIYDGFTGADLTMEGVASVTDGLLRLSSGLSQSQGHAFYPYPVTNFSSDGSAASFSTTFVFAIINEYPDLSGHGFAFVLSPTEELFNALPSQFLGLFDIWHYGNASNHLLPIEFDTNNEFEDINGNHIWINMNSLISIASHTAGYYTSDGVFQNLSLISTKPMQVWVDYDSEHTELNVTIAPYMMMNNKPRQPLPRMYGHGHTYRT